MIKIDEFKRVCRLAGLIELKKAIPTFSNKEKTEAVELNTDKLLVFKFENGEQKYLEQAQSKEITSVVGAFEKDVRSITDEPKKIDEPIPNKTTKEDTETVSKIGGVSALNTIPEILEEKRIIAPQDLDAWKKLSTFERILLFQKTPKGLIKQRRGYLLPEFAGRDKKTLTDAHFKMFSYIPANILKQSANIAFLFEWSAVVESEKYFENEVAVRGYFQVEINGKQYRRPCGGSCIKKGMMDWGDTMEGAISEMTTRGIYNFLHGDVKRGDFDEN